MSTLKDKMTNLADAVRSKYSVTGLLTLDQITSTIENSTIGQGPTIDWTESTVEPQFVLSGYSYIEGTNDSSDIHVIPGAMENHGVLEVNVSKSVQTFEEGYYESIKVFPGVDTLGVSATSVDIRKGKTAGVSNEIITGDMPEYKEWHCKPGIVHTDIPEGYHVGGWVEGDINLQPEYIRHKIDIFGITGNFTGDATATAGDIRIGKTAGILGEMVTGTMEETSIPGGSSEAAFYKCISVDTGYAYGPYQDVSISGITGTLPINGEFEIIDPRDTGTSRIFLNGEYKLGFDNTTSTWCITKGIDSTPNPVYSIFHTEAGLTSAETGTAEDPIWWDTDGVTESGDRCITREYNTYEAPIDEESWTSAGWNFYVKLKAGTTYTLGMICPPDDIDMGYEYYPSFNVYDTNGNTLVSGIRNSSPVTVSGFDVHVYCTYTPTETSVVRLQAMEDWCGIDTRIACTPEPETSAPESADLFGQANWVIGGGPDGKITITGAGRQECNQDYTQIEGNGVALDSVWSSSDGRFYIYVETLYSSYQYRWMLYTEKGFQNAYIYKSETWSPEDPVPHPASIAWNDSGYSDDRPYPTLNTKPMEGVGGTPVLTAVDKPGREAVDTIVWDGVLMSQNSDGVLETTSTINKGMVSTKLSPAPGFIYNEDCSVKIGSSFENKYGCLYGYGSGTYGSLLGQTSITSPVLLTDKLFKKIATYSYTVVAIDMEGNLWGWGQNSNGQLGTGSTASEVKTPMKVTTGVVYKDVVCGYYRSYAIDEEGYLWSTGYNAYGQLGTGNTSNYMTFTKVGTKKWISVSCHTYGTILIDDSGYMYGVGHFNSPNTLGNGTTSSVTYNTFTKLNDKKWSKIFTNDNIRTFAIDSDGYLWSTGDNSNGSLGIGNSTAQSTFTQVNKQKWIDVAASRQHTIAISAEGYMYGWGTNNIGQLGNGTTTNSSTPVKNGSKKWKSVCADTAFSVNYSVAIDEYGLAYWFGGDSGNITPYRAYTPQVYNINGSAISMAATTYQVYILTKQ